MIQNQDRTFLKVADGVGQLEWRGLSQHHGIRRGGLVNLAGVRKQNVSHGDGAAGVVLLVLLGDVLGRCDVQAASR